MRTAIVGIGQELRGDDALGIVIARRLKPLAVGHPDWLVIDAGPAPENFSGVLRRFAPQRIFLVDAALMDEEPGTVRQLDWREAASGSSAGFAAATHGLPLSALAGYLALELGCEVILIGVQPGSNTFDSPLTPAAQQALDGLVGEFAALIDS